MVKCQCGEVTEVGCDLDAETRVWWMPDWKRSSHANAGYASIGSLSNPKAAGALRLGVSLLCASNLQEQDEDWVVEID